jgi:hypothetical protein
VYARHVPYTTTKPPSAWRVASEAITALFVRKVLGHQRPKLRGETLALFLVPSEGKSQKQFKENGTRSIKIACPILQSCLQSRGSREQSAPLSITNQLLWAVLADLQLLVGSGISNMRGGLAPLRRQVPISATAIILNDVAQAIGKLKVHQLQSHLYVEVCTKTVNHDDDDDAHNNVRCWRRCTHIPPEGTNEAWMLAGLTSRCTSPAFSCSSARACQQQDA